MTTRYVDSEIADLLEAGAGVCQDFVHLGLCLLRHHGIAARYVSGYLFAGGSEDGHGRHYADVPPIKGVYRGAATAKLDASVTMTRLERTDPASIARS
jgi:Transglutaminase-like superfamily